MTIERFRWLAAVVAASKQGRIYGRTRLQKTIKLLQRLGLPADYSYTNYFYGPYSDGVQSDIGVLESMGLLEEKLEGTGGSPYFVIKAKSGAEQKSIQKFQKYIDLMEGVETVILELAATYDAFREMGSSHSDSMERLRRKKGTKCDGDRDKEALELLKHLGLTYN
jgi:uncharacterized protein